MPYESGAARRKRPCGSATLAFASGAELDARPGGISVACSLNDMIAALALQAIV
jgi:hypothetical protein